MVGHKYLFTHQNAYVTFKIMILVEISKVNAEDKLTSWCFSALFCEVRFAVVTLHCTCFCMWRLISSFHICVASDLISSHLLSHLLTRSMTKHALEGVFKKLKTYKPFWKVNDNLPLIGNVFYFILFKFKLLHDWYFLSGRSWYCPLLTNESLHVHYGVIKSCIQMNSWNEWINLEFSSCLIRTRACVSLLFKFKTKA